LAKAACLPRGHDRCSLKMPLLREVSPRGAGRAALLAVLLVQLVLVSLTFPVDQLLSSQPLFHIDGAYHWYQLHVARELAAQGRLTGYDPYFAAGHLGGVTLNASAKLPAVIAWLFTNRLSEIQSYKIFVFFAAVVAPCFVTLGALLMRLDARPVWFATALGMCAWWASAIRWYQTAGMTSFVFASFLALLYFVLIIEVVRAEQVPKGRVVLLGVLGAFGLLVHPLFPVSIVLATAAYLAFAWRQVHWIRALSLFTVIAVISVPPNVPWILGMTHADDALAVVLPYQTRVDITTIPKEMIGIWRDGLMGAKLYAGLMATSLIAAAAAPTARLRSVARCSLLVWAVIAVFAAVGAAIPGAASVQPNRFAGMAYLFLIYPASIGIETLGLTLRAQAPTTKLLGVLVGAIAVLSFGWSATEVVREVSRAPVGHYGSVPPETRPLGEKSTWLLEWLAANTSKEGRVLFETSKGRIHDGAHMAGYYAASADREFIGGPYPFMFRAGFWDDFAFGEPLDAMSPDRFDQLVHLYNVGWIVVHSGAAKRFLSSAPNVVQVGEHDDLRLYRVDGPLSYFLAGNGRVEARGINRLVLSDLDGSEIIVKYHFVPGLSGGSSAKVEPVAVPGALGSFTKVTPVSGVRRVELFVQ
jgi:hypothetical protein